MQSRNSTPSYLQRERETPFMWIFKLTVVSESMNYLPKIGGSMVCKLDFSKPFFLKQMYFLPSLIMSELLPFREKEPP